MRELVVELHTKSANISSEKVHKIWRESGSIIQSLIQDAEKTEGLASISDHTRAIYSLAPRQQVQWRNARPGDVSIRDVQGHAVRVRVKTGGQDTVWEYDLIPPHGLDANRLRLALIFAVEARADAAGEPAGVMQTIGPDPSDLIDRIADDLVQKTAANGGIVNNPTESKLSALNRDKLDVAKAEIGDIGAILSRFAEVAKRQEARRAQIADLESREERARKRAGELREEADAAQRTAENYAAQLLEVMAEEEADTDAHALRQFAKLFSNH